jgi:hypothetical protein
MHTETGNAELYGALAKAQGEIVNAAKNSKNPHFKSDYADLASILDTVKPALSKNGIAVIQGTAFDGSMVTVTTVLAHAGGGSISSEASCVPAKMDGQGIGSATTYLRRYGLAAMTGVAQADLDGEDSKHSTPPAPAIRQPKVKPNVPQDAVEKVIEAIQAGRGTADKAIAHWKRKYTISADLEKLLRENEPEVAA